MLTAVLAGQNSNGRQRYLSRAHPVELARYGRMTNADGAFGHRPSASAPRKLMTIGLATLTIAPSTGLNVGGRNAAANKRAGFCLARLLLPHLPAGRRGGASGLRWRRR